MTDEEKIKQINEIYTDFETKLQEHRVHIRELVQETLRKIEQARAQELSESIKRDFKP